MNLHSCFHKFLRFPDFFFFLWIDISTVEVAQVFIRLPGEVYF